MVRKMPCFCMPPKSTRMSSTTALVELALTRMVDWKDLMTHPSSAVAVALDTATASVQARVAIASLAARIFIGSPPGCDLRCRPDLRRPCDASASLPPALLAHASTDALAAVLVGA